MLSAYSKARRILRFDFIDSIGSRARKAFITWPFNTRRAGDDHDPGHTSKESIFDDGKHLVTDRWVCCIITPFAERTASSARRLEYLTAAVTLVMEDSSTRPETDSGVGQPRTKLRSYQQEMLEASLQRNVIVAMDTGSGKTHIALFRILAEIERAGPSKSKLIWFLTPQVALSVQQHAVLAEHLPGYTIKTLLGSDGVDKWTDQRLWDATLTNVRVVVGTPAVLAEALTHGFVRISQLALLVFDEAHNCIGNSPMNKIMKDFYHPGKARRESVPHILGLSASPVMSAKSTTLAQLEGNLDAIVVTPKVHRFDLESYVHTPRVTRITHARAPTYDASQTPGCTALLEITRSYNLLEDPYVVELDELAKAGDGRAARNLEKVRLKRNTWCLEQLSTLRRRALVVQEQLGASASEFYIHKCCVQFLENMSTDVLILPDLNQKEKAHLARQLRSCSPQRNSSKTGQDAPIVTDKVRSLVTALEQHDPSSTRVLIFAEQRAVVTALAHLLREQFSESMRPYSFATFVGTSMSDKRKTGLPDLADIRHQQKGLEDFHSGRVNAIISTSVLEEGIDVSACNLVMCFDPPKTLVAFVQRRGRARQRDSKYIMLLPADDPKASQERWSRLEAEMKEAYMDEQRQADPGAQDDTDAMSSVVYRVEATGAMLTLDNAKAHLYHFCQVSSTSSKFVDTRPEFTTRRDDTSEKRKWSASVTLPSFVHADLRTADSPRQWASKETAVKHASFAAYLALYKRGLVNDNLLPLTRDYGPDPGQLHVDQPSLVRVAERYCVWRDVGLLAAYENTAWHKCTVTVRRRGNDLISMELRVPFPIPPLGEFTLFWNESAEYTVDLRDSVEYTLNETSEKGMKLVEELTDDVLRSVHGARMRPSPNRLPFMIIDHHFLHERIATSGTMDAVELLTTKGFGDQCGLLRVKGQSGRAYFFSDIVPADGTQETALVATVFPKRKDFLHRVPETNENAAYTGKQTLPASTCTVDNLPAKYALFAAFIPSILHRVDLARLASGVQSDVLRGIHIHDQNLLREAICSPSAQEPHDYNRLEFLGDSVLKHCSVLHVMAKHPTWPEGYLVLEKSRMVSNNCLAKAAVELNLDQYIVVKPFTGAKWRPPYFEEMPAVDEKATREMSSKVLADVVEALIGACFVDGGLEKSYECIRTLLPLEEWMPQSVSLEVLSSETTHRGVELGLVERLVGHRFNNPGLLLEAITHASFPHSSTAGSSYERLEYLGDGVLDLVVVPKLHAHSRRLRHWDLHRTRDALVNGDYLAFRCMEFCIEEESFDVVKGQQGSDIRDTTRPVHLHDFLRAGVQLTREKSQYLEVSKRHREAVRFCLTKDSEYPWPELIALRAPKYLSDIVESVLGALYVDSKGDLSVCEAFVERLGILDDMHRILDEHVETAYPKEQVGILSDRDSVRYSAFARSDGEGRQVFDCTVTVGDEEVATVVGYESKEEAELRAARQATRVLEKKVGLEGKKRKLDVAVREVDQAT